MPRNGSGVMAIANTFLPGTTISSSAMNANLTDIATELTNSLPRDGQAGMGAAAQIMARDGTALLPGYAWVSDTDTGFYMSGSNEMSWATGGVRRGYTDTNGKHWLLYALDVAGAANFQAAATFANAVTIARAGLLLTLQDSTNTTAEREMLRLALGDASGNTASIRAVGSGSNAVSKLRHYIGSTQLDDVAAALWNLLINLRVGASGITIDSSGFLNLPEISAPSAPSADNMRLYAKDSGGVTGLYFKNSADTEYPVPFAATQAQQEAASATTPFVSPGTQHYHPASPKAWVYFNAAGTIQSSYGVDSVTKSSTGVFDVTLSVVLSTANYCAIPGIIHGATNMGIAASRSSASAVRLRTFVCSTGVGADPGDGASLVIFGDI